MCGMKPVMFLKLIILQQLTAVVVICKEAQYVGIIDSK